MFRASQKLLILGTILLALLAGTLTLQAAGESLQPSSQEHLVILHVNDTHGHSS